MPTWKVLLILLCCGICAALAGASLIVPLSMEGNQRWMWLGILLPATLVACGLLAWLLRYVGRTMD